jgi:hypothetical protein
MNKRGMQSDILASPELQEKWAGEWQNLAQVCRDQVKAWSDEGMHKQHANRPLEWFGWIDVLITATSWRNFFELRISEYAQPEFDHLARMIQDEMAASTPTLLQPGEWHLPYITVEDLGDYGLDRCKALSTARCARLSYRPFDGKGDIDAEIKRHDDLVVARPVHASPAEHQCTPDTVFATHDHGVPNFPEVETLWDNAHLHGNLTGWIQYRKTLPHEAVMEQYS